MNDVADQLTKLHALKEKGALSQQEFDRLKESLLAIEAPQTASADAIPALWDPKSARNWSIVLTPAFGAFIHAKNWGTLGEHELAEEHRNVMVLNILTVIAIGLIAFVGPFGHLQHATPKHASYYLSDTIQFLLFIGYVGTAIGWHKEAAPTQIEYVQENIDLNYRRREFIGPVFVGMIYVAVVLILLNLGSEIYQRRSASADAADRSAIQSP